LLAPHPPLTRREFAQMRLAHVVVCVPVEGAPRGDVFVVVGAEPDGRVHRLCRSGEGFVGVGLAFVEGLQGVGVIVHGSDGVDFRQQHGVRCRLRHCGGRRQTREKQQTGAEMFHVVRRSEG
jgi:hypothetical protein